MDSDLLDMESDLMTAVREDDISRVRSLIEKGANINSFTSGRTPLSIAALQGNVAMLELLLNCGHIRHNNEKITEKKSNKNGTRKKERTAFKKRKAAEGNNGYYEVIYDDTSDESESDANRNVSLDEAETPEGMDGLEWDMELEDDGSSSENDDPWSDQYRWYAKILAKSCYVPSDLPYSCDVNLQDSIGRCALHYAAEYGHVNAVKILINTGCKADIGDVDSLTPLHLAASRGHKAVVETLISSGCLVNAKTTEKLSPLHYAAARGYTDVVNALLDAGAHVDSLDEGERTPLILAVSRNLLEVAEVLIKRGARVNIEDVKGYTAMYEAVRHKSVPMVKLLVNAGAKVVPTNHLVQYAVLHRQKEMVATLLESGALVNIRDCSGDTPLITAAISNQPDMVNLLISYGAAVDCAGGSSGNTALFNAVTRSQKPCPQVLQSLVEAGADLERDTWGNTPLSAAIVGKKTKAAIALVAFGAKLSWNMELVKLTGPTSVVRAFVAAGYDIHRMKDIPPPPKWPIETDDVYQYLQYAKYNPLSLSDLCRISVRSQYVGAMSKWISSLQVPTRIKRYLMLDDVMNMADMEEIKMKCTNETVRFEGLLFNFNQDEDCRFRFINDDIFGNFPPDFSIMDDGLVEE